MPDESGRFKGVSVPRVPWHEIPVTPEEDEAFESQRKDTPAPPVPSVNETSPGGDS